MYSTPETSVHVQHKNREISPLEREEGYGEKDMEKRWVLRREWKTLWDTPTTNLGAESKVLAVKLSRSSGWSGSYTGLIGFNLCRLPRNRPSCLCKIFFFGKLCERILIYGCDTWLTESKHKVNARTELNEWDGMMRLFFKERRINGTA